jgi:lipopolysaccharide transport system permease protein
MFKSILQYKEFIYSCVKREFQAKYKGSIFGVAWAIFHPLALIFVYTVIFSNIMKNRLAGMTDVPYAYSLYLCSGVLTWGLFTETLTRCTNVFLDNSNLMKKVFFPRICLPVITMLSSFLNFIIAFVLFLLFMLIIGKFPVTLFPTFFVVLFVQTVFAVTLGVGLGVLNVFFRDIGQFLAMILQFWFWFTPVVYPSNIVPQRLQNLLYLNPMYHVIHAYQNIFVYNKLPDFKWLGAVLVLSVIMGYWALYLYRKHVGEMVDEL